MCCTVATSGELNWTSLILSRSNRTEHNEREELDSNQNHLMWVLVTFGKFVDSSSRMRTTYHRCNWLIVFVEILTLKTFRGRVHMTFKGHSKSPTVSPFDKSSPNLYLFPIVKTCADLLPFLRYNKNREFFYTPWAWPIQIYARFVHHRNLRRCGLIIFGWQCELISPFTFRQNI